LSGLFSVIVATRASTWYSISWFCIMTGIIYNRRHVSNIHLCATIGMVAPGRDARPLTSMRDQNPIGTLQGLGHWGEEGCE
jgi:hypothetical protein